MAQTLFPLLAAITFLATCARPFDTRVEALQPDLDPWATCRSSAEMRGSGRAFTLLDAAPAVDPLTDSPYAAGHQWYRDNDAVRVRGQGFVKFGRLRRINPDGMRTAGNDLLEIGKLGGVRVYVEVASGLERPGVIFVPSHPGCLFQTYQLRYDDELPAWTP
jgi:hypothetical protein